MNGETAHMELTNCMKAIKLANPRKYLFYITQNLSGEMLM
jgi:hypothetical protein